MKSLLLALTLAPSLLSAQMWKRDSTKSEMDSRWGYSVQTTARSGDAILVMDLGCSAATPEPHINLYLFSNLRLSGTLVRGTTVSVAETREKWDSAPPVTVWDMILSNSTVLSRRPAKTFDKAGRVVELSMAPLLDSLSHTRELLIEVPLLRGERPTFRFAVGDSIPMAWIRERCHQ